MGRPATQKDIARLVGVSQAAVSQVLSRKPGAMVAEGTRERIFSAARDLAYTPDPAARSLRTGKTQTIATLIPDITNPFYPAFQLGVQGVADAHEHDLILYNTDSAAAKERKSLASLAMRRVDGAIVVLFHTSSRFLAPLLEAGTPVVRLTASAPRDTEWPLDSLYLNNEAAARAAVTFLIERGHERIGLITADVGPGRERARGYHAALLAAGFTPQPRLTRSTDFTFEGGREAARALLEGTARPSAIFAANDLMALGVMAAAHDLGLSIPQDLAVVGFDDLLAASLVTPALTTVTQFSQRLGRRAAEMLFERLDGRETGPGRREEAPFQLIARGSA